MSEQTFHQFPKLPTELRLKIWRLAQPDREIIPILHDARRDRRDPNAPECWESSHIIVPIRKKPSLFQVCSESRDACLAEYTRNFEGDHDAGLEHRECSRYQMARFRARLGSHTMDDSGERDIYWRPKLDVMLFKKEIRWRKLAAVACMLHVSEAPFGGLETYGVQHIILPMTFFGPRGFDPRTCACTWGMETVYIILEREKEDTPEFWEEHLTWFGRWWLKACKPWRETVGEDAPLQEQVPFLPKTISLYKEQELTRKDLDDAKECVLVKEDEASGVADRSENDDKIHEVRYWRGWR